MPVDILDRTAAAPGALAGPDGKLSPAPPGSPRTVVFLLDSAFTSPSGVRNARVVAEKLLREIPEGQHLSLWFHSAAHGLEQKVASVAADQRGRGAGREVERAPRCEPFTFLITLQFIVVISHDLIDIPGWPCGAQVRSLVGPRKLWLVTLVNGIGLVLYPRFGSA